MKSIRWRITIFYVILILVSMTGLSFFITDFVRSTYLDTIKTHLIRDTRVISADIAPLIIKNSLDPEINIKASQYAKKLEARITIILPSGQVIGESEYSLTEMENHLDRPEIQQALHGTENFETRFSDTLKTQMLYAAVPVKDGEKIIAIARVAYSLKTVESQVNFLRSSIFTATIITILAAIIISILVTQKTIGPLHKLTDEVLEMSRGSLKNVTPITQTDEIGQLHKAFQQLSTQLSAQISQLTQEQARLSSVLSHMTDGIIIVDSKGHIQLINSAAERMFATTEEKAIGDSLIEVVRNHQFVELFNRCHITNEQQSLALETTQEKIFIQVIATPMGKTLTGNILLVFQDLTRLRKLEIVRRDFVSNVSHELRTPLASLKALTETLSEGALEDPPAARRFLIQMENEIDNLTQMVQELLELSKIESGKVPLERIKALPDDLITAAFDRMHLQAERAGLNLTLDIPENLTRVYADPQRIQQVLINLIHNAIKFTPPGGKITLSASQDENSVVFSVKDTGSGIDPSALERIFERFYKADRARSTGGTGLGLSIAKHTIENHGGRIWAHSEPGKGSTFYFSLPIQ